MKTAKPFTWVVRFTVAPVWCQDGFTLTDDRAHNMLCEALSHAHGDELAAVVLEAPSPLQLARVQGYGPKTPGSGPVLREIMDGTTQAGKLRAALLAARTLLDSVAFVAKEGDAAPVIEKLNQALEAIDARQGEAVEIEA